MHVKTNIAKNRKLSIVWLHARENKYAKNRKLSIVGLHVKINMLKIES